MLLGPPCVSPAPSCDSNTWRSSAWSSPLVSFKNDRFGAVVYDHAAAGERDARRNAQVLGEDGELVGPAVAVGVFADANSIATFISRLQFVRIIDGFANPQPTAFVPRHADRLAAELGLGGEQLDVKPFRHDHALHRFSRASGFCILWNGSPCSPHFSLAM